MGGGAQGVRCSVTYDALQSSFGLGPFDLDLYLAALRQQRPVIEEAVRRKYLYSPVGFDRDVFVERRDLEAVIPTTAS